MKNFKILSIIGIMIILVSCRPPNDQAELRRLEMQRDQLTSKIDDLKVRITASAGDISRPETIRTVSAEKVAMETFRHFIQVQGTLESDNNVLVAPQSSGLVKKVLVSAGDRVARGRLLAELDGSILESSISEVENGLALATTVYERQKRLWDKNIGSEIEFLQAKNGKEGLEKRLDTLREQYKLTKVYAPIDGTVDEVLLKEGEMAMAGMGAVRVVQLSNLKIAVALSENFIASIKKRDPVKVSIPVIGKELQLRVDAVSQVIDPDNRTFQIEIKIPRTASGIKPNMLAVLSINDYTNPEAVAVPINVVQETELQKFLFVAEKLNGDWIARRRTVTTGQTQDNRVEILSGLEAGEYVVTLGFQNLTDGQKMVVAENI
jgi:membrane fusion protein (multidrug efflux system)